MGDTMLCLGCGAPPSEHGQGPGDGGGCPGDHSVNALALYRMWCTEQQRADAAAAEVQTLRAQRNDALSRLEGMMRSRDVARQRLLAFIESVGHKALTTRVNAAEAEVARLREALREMMERIHARLLRTEDGYARAAVEAWKREQNDTAARLAGRALGIAEAARALAEANRAAFAAPAKQPASRCLAPSPDNKMRCGRLEGHGGDHTAYRRDYSLTAPEAQHWAASPPAPAKPQPDADPVCEHTGCGAPATEMDPSDITGRRGMCAFCRNWHRYPHFSDCDHGAPAKETP